MHFATLQVSGKLTTSEVTHTLPNHCAFYERTLKEVVMSVLTAKHLLTVDHLEVIATLPPGSRFFMPNVRWEEYEHLLSQLEENSRFRLSYDQGKLELMTLSPRHESFKVLFT